MKRLQKRMQVLIGDYPVTIKLVRFHVSLSTTYVWNGLFDRAIDVEKCDYFMTVHDDSNFIPIKRTILGGCFDKFVVK